MTPGAVAPPVSVLWRIGHWPDPCAWPPREARVREPGRFDDPQHAYRILYVAEQRLGCFIEAIARFRIPLAVLKDAGPRAVLLARVPASWQASRCIGQVRLAAGQHFLDLRTIETTEVLRAELAPLLHRLGFFDLDVSGVRGPSRTLTMAISRWAHAHGFQGIVYRSRFDDALDCWAVFEGAAFQRVGLAVPILPDDADLLAAAHRFGLAV